MNKKASSDPSALANGGLFAPTPKLEELKRKRFPPEGKAEHVERSLAALRDLPPMQLTAEQLWEIAMSPDLEEQ